MPDFRKSKRKAFGLIEVLIAIAISGVIMVSATSIAAQSLRTVKENEMKDIASGILLRSLEIARSPVSYQLSSKVTSGGENYFSLELVRDAETNRESYDLVGANTGGLLTGCVENSPYIVPDIVEYGYSICNQVIVNEVESKPITAGVELVTYSVESVVVYRFLNQDFQDRLVSYRSELVNV